MNSQYDFFLGLYFDPKFEGLIKAGSPVVGRAQTLKKDWDTTSTKGLKSEESRISPGSEDSEILKYKKD